MRIAGQYHYLIAGLPEISLEDAQYEKSLLAFKEFLQEQVQPDEFDLVRQLFLSKDHENLISFLYDENPVYTELANYPGSIFEEELERLDSILPEKPELPDYMIELIRKVKIEKEVVSRKEAELFLLKGFYSHVLPHSNPFLNQWFEFELNTSNIIAAYVARKHNKDPETEILEVNSLASVLASPGKLPDLRMIMDVDYISEAQRIAEIEDFKEREKALDRFRWSYLDELSLFHYFEVETVITYLLKLMMIFRWKELDGNEGKKIYDQMLRNFKKSFVLPDDYSIIKKQR